MAAKLACVRNMLPVHSTKVSIKLRWPRPMKDCNMKYRHGKNLRNCKRMMYTNLNFVLAQQHMYSPSIMMIVINVDANQDFLRVVLTLT